jgi:hypothetical protein
MVRPLVLLTLTLGALLALAASAAAQTQALGPPYTPPDVQILSRTAIDPDGRAWVSGHRVMGTSGLVEYYDAGAWHALAPPPLRYPDAILPLSIDDVWIAGGAKLAHWDGAAWRITPHPRVRGLDIRDIAAVSPDDLWAVGRRNGLLMRLPGDGTGERTQLQSPATLHWDGRAWSVVRTPALPGVDQGLDAVAAGGGRVWAVGKIQRLTNAQEIGSSAAGPRFKCVPLALQWRGGAWRSVRHANYGRGGTYLVDVAVLGDGTAWTAGVVRGDAEGEGKYQRWYTLVEQRAGAQWVVRQASTYRWRVLPWALAATSDSDVWVAFMDNRGWPGVERWDGDAWRTYAVEELGWTPGSGMIGTGIPDVAAAPGGVWLLGGFTLLADESDTVGDQLVWRHDAAGWTRIPFVMP